MTISLPALADTDRSDVDIELEESVKSRATHEVTARDFRFLQRLDDTNQIGVEELDRDGDRVTVLLSSTRYAGVISLPDGGQIYIKPKVTGTALLRLLQYSEYDQVDLIEQEAQVQAGTDYVELLGELFTDELRSVLRKGPEQAYERVTRDEEYVRGRLNVHQQLQTHGPAAPAFNCTHEELTRDTDLNQTVLYAGWLLHGVMEESTTQRHLRRLLMQLRRDVTLRPVSSEEGRNVELTHLNHHYQDILRIAILVLESTFIEDLAPGESSAYTILLLMEDRFEDVVQKATASLLETEPNTTASWGDFFDDEIEFAPEPDVVIEDGQEPIAVVDAKWKTDEGRPSREDIYQMVGYQTYSQSPAALVYPTNDDGGLEQTATVKNGQTLYVGTLPVIDNTADTTTYTQQLEEAMEEILSPMVS